MDIDAGITFGVVALTMLMTHPVADYAVQTDHQAQHKGLTGARTREGWWNAAKHAFSYTVTQVLVVGLVLEALDFTGSFGVVVLVLIANGLTHMIIDRRWTLEWFARNVLLKSGWIDADKTALPHLDQTAHIGLFVPAALAIATLS